MSAMNPHPISFGFVEVAFLSVAVVVADRIVKASGARLLGIETTGNERLMLRLQGDLPAVQCALAEAETCVNDLKCSATVASIPRPENDFLSLLHFPNAQNTLYGGRDQFLPTDYPNPENQTMQTHDQALGILETQGLTAILEATDAMLKAANVTLVGKEKIGAAYVTVIVRGDVAAVKAAVDAGSQAVGHLGKLIAAHVIARPHPDIVSLLPKN